MDEQHVDEYIDAYALGALESEEVASVESHLEYCARCQQLATAARAAARVLLYGAPVAEPPADLRARVLQRVHQVAMADANHASADTHIGNTLAPADRGDTATLSTEASAGAGQG